MKAIAFIALFSLVITIYPNVTFAELSQHTNVPVNKMWTVHFNTDMEQDSVDENSVYILNEEGEKLEDITFKWVNNSTLKVINDTPYNYDHEYDLYIKESVRSTRNKKMSKELHFSFTTQDKPETLSTQDVIKNNDPKVVMVETDYAQGSGVIVGEGLILTNEHVVAGMESGKVTLNNGETFSIEGIVTAKKDADLALIKIEKPIDIDPVQIGDPDLLTKGDDIVTIGNPMSLQNTASEGMISGFRDEGIELIQITAPITQGSSGGGLFNEQGELVGITSFVLGQSGNLNFAVSVDELQDWSHILNRDFEDLNTKTTEKPENVEVSLLPYNGVMVNWDEVSDADYYQIYFGYSKDGQYTRLESLDGKASFQDSIYLDIDVKPGETYYYSVVAVKDGVESPLSESAKIVIPTESDITQDQTSLGMTKRDVKKAQTSNLLEETENKLIYKGLNALKYEYVREYIFKNDKLTVMKETILLPNYDSKEVLSKLNDQFIFLANLLYGEPINVDNNWGDDSTGSFVGAKWDQSSDDKEGYFTFDIGFEDDSETAIVKTVDKGEVNDNSSPELENVETSSAKTLEFYFNENIQFTDGSNEFLNSISATNLNIEGATAEINGDILTITLKDDQQFADNYRANDLSIPEGVIQDIAGNTFEVTGAAIQDGWVTQVKEIDYVDNTEGGGSTPKDIGLTFNDIGDADEDESQSPFDIMGYYIVPFEDGTSRDEAAAIIKDAIINSDPKYPGTGFAKVMYEGNIAGYLEASSDHEGSLKVFREEQLVFSGAEMGPGDYEVFIIPLDYSLNYTLSEPISVTIGD